ncbi:uncharacterized protein LOC125609956 [Brassica napus]|uniref:uncharacterized protein LOC125609956 n=1 Tax=Brassica napus TaxID=3708 RepID=UPI0020789D12|nr:uncharacterized protein LOC125609956 [Brassica napus]
MWKKLLKLRPLALQFTQMEVHNGLLTSFWFDQWSHLGVLINLTGERGCIDLGISINTTPYRLRRHRTSVFIEREILRLRALAPDLSDDICLWKRENNEFRPGATCSMVKGIWFKEATPKYSFLAWLAAHNRLSTGDRLLRRNPQAISTCWLCNSAKESMYHLFFECPFSGEVWRGTVRGLISTILPV